MTLKELVQHTGLAPSTVARQCQKLFADRELSRRYQLGERNIHFVYYFIGNQTQFSKKREEVIKVRTK
jgi:DNA-binding IclR family transcriptional regulator